MKSVVAVVGATLLELLLVLSVAAMIILGSLQLMRSHMHELSTQTLKESLNTTLLLMNAYYRATDPDSSPPQAYCFSSTLDATALADLKAWATASASFTSDQLNLIKNPLGTPLTIAFVGTKINSGGSASEQYTVYKFQISAAFPNLNAEQIKLIQGKLNADGSAMNNTLTWTRMPGQGLGNEISSLAVASGNLDKKMVYYNPNYHIPPGRNIHSTGLPCPP